MRFDGLTARLKRNKIVKKAAEYIRASCCHECLHIDVLTTTNHRLGFIKQEIKIKIGEMSDISKREAIKYITQTD
jgi:hypothetical protein